MRPLCLIALAVCLVAPFPKTYAAGVGDAAPTFRVPLIQGGELDIGTYMGKKVIILDWWSINCASCVQEIPKLIDIYNRYSKEVLVVGMNVDSFIVKRVERFLRTQTFQVTYPTVIDAQLNVMKQYGSSILPTTVVIDRKGKIVYHHVGYKEGDEREIEASVRRALGGK